MYNDKRPGPRRLGFLAVCLCFLFNSASVYAQASYETLLTPFYDPTSSACVPATTSAPSIADNAIDLASLASRYGLHSVLIKQIGGGEVASLNSKGIPDSPASTLKAIIADTLLQSNPDLSKDVTVLSRHLYEGTGAGSIQDPKAGKTVSLGEALEITLTYSSNTYANVLIDAAGGLSGFTEKAKSLGYSSTEAVSYFNSSATRVNKTTVTDLTAAMEHLYTTRAEGYTRAQKALQNSTVTFGINSQANKWGGNSRVTGNSAVVVNSKYIVSMYINAPYNGPDTGPATKVRDATNEIVDYLKRLDASATASGSGGLCQSSCQAEVAGTLPATVPQPHNGLFSQAAASQKINPQFLAAVFLSEQGNVWRPFDTEWKTSPAGAAGPFQFMPLTWEGYQTDGDNDGIKDRQNIYDAAYGAAKMLATYTGVNSPLGSLDRPFVPNTILWASANYNWGPGNVQIHTTPDSPLSVLPLETEEYLRNIHSLISSGFTKSGKPGYPDPTPGTGTGGAATSRATCIASSGVVQAALNMAWPGPHSPQNEAKPEYIEALKKYNPSGLSAASLGADCGIFVSTVVRASGADSEYPISGTSLQAEYVRAHPEKYDVVERVQSTADLQPGDILIVNGPGGGDGGNGHTYIFVGKQSGGDYNQASASYNSSDPSQGRMPSLGTAAVQDDRGFYIRARLR